MQESKQASKERYTERCSTKRDYTNPTAAVKQLI